MDSFFLRRSGALVNGALETISPLFHTARTLSGALRSPPSPRGEGLVCRYSFSTYACICFDDARKAAFSYRSLPHWGRGTAQRRSGALVNCRLETHFLALFHTARTLSGSLCSPPSPRGEGFVRRYSFSTYACICSDNARKAVFSFRSLPHWGRGTAQRWIGCSRIMAYLRRSSPLIFHTARTLSGWLHSPSSPRGEGCDTEIPLPPSNLRPLLGTSFHRKEGVSTRAPSLGRGCRAQRGGVGFLFRRRSRHLHF